jgi:N-acetylmuramoyl-L-alanine amidase
MQIIQSFLPIGPARKGIKLDKVLAVVLHWPAAPGQRAQETRNFWAGPANAEGSSAHCVIDEDGTIVQVMSWDEVAYHVGSAQPDPVSGRIYTDLARAMFGGYASNPKTTSPNHVTIGIEMATTDADGTYTPETVAAAVELCAQLCATYSLDPSADIVRHYDVVGWKKCPKWYVDHPEDLAAFHAAVATKLAN